METKAYEPPENARKAEPIRKMALKESAIVEIVRIESPESIFVRPIDHIRNRLVFREPYQLTKIAENGLKIGIFALAPIEEREFGRCQILDILEKSKIARVFFIDDAITADVTFEVLFEIEETQTFYPWQTMHVSLGRVSTLEENGWNLEQKRQFSEILQKFDTFQLTAAQVDLDVDFRRPSILANLYGLDPSGDLSKKVAIEQLCAVLMENVQISQFPLNILEQSPHILDDFSVSEIHVEPFRKCLPTDWLHEIPSNWADEEGDWCVGRHVVPEWCERTIEKFRTTQNGTIFAMAEPKCTISPREMHVYPVNFRENSTDIFDEAWIFEEFARMTEFLQVIDDFYSDVRHQKPLGFEEIKSHLELENGRKLYAMVSVHHRKRAGPSWYRCEILDVMSTNNVAVRFLDYGGKSFEKLRNLFRIHRQHTVQTPLCLEICGKVPQGKIDAEQFRQLVPYDTPLVLGPEIEFSPDGKLQFSRIRSLTDGENENLLEKIRYL